jgi:hypothetical protein
MPGKDQKRLTVGLFVTIDKRTRRSGIVNKGIITYLHIGQNQSDTVCIGVLHGDNILDQRSK